MFFWIVLLYLDCFWNCWHVGTQYSTVYTIRFPISCSQTVAIFWLENRNQEIEHVSFSLNFSAVFSQIYFETIEGDKMLPLLT